MTLGVGADPLAFANSRLALSYSRFSDSSFTAASQISSLLGFAWKARARIPRAAGTSPASHLLLAPINQSTSLLGQWATALCKRPSRLSLVP